VRRGLPSSALPVAAVAASLALCVLPGRGEGAIAGCPSFRSQASAQDYFAGLGGTPGKRVGGLDDDRDGVACEGRPGPYKGFATIGYSARGFLFGAASMPPDALLGGYACLEGNRHFADGPRLLTVYRVERGADREIASEVGAQATPGSGRLLWKVKRSSLAPGAYYAEFEARIPLTPYGGNECPGFRSRPTALPPPAR
jgi:hypothetical protein